MGASRSTQQRVERARSLAGPGAAKQIADLGDLYFALGYSGAAGACYRRSFALQPNIESGFLAASTTRESGDTATAETYFHRVLDLDAKHKSSRLSLAEMLLENHKLELSIESYRHVLSDYPGDPQALVGLGRALLAAGRGDEAATALVEVLRLRPHATSVHASIAEAYRAIGRPDLARGHLTKAGPGAIMSDDLILARVGRLRIELIGETVIALSEQETVSAEDVAGFTVAQLGPVPGAVAGLKQIAPKLVSNSGQHSARFWFAVGALADRQGNPNEAEAAYGQAINEDPRLSSAKLRRAQALVKLERWDDAAALFKELPSLDTKHIRDYASTLAQTDELSPAASLLQNAIDNSPQQRDREQLQLDLADVQLALGQTVSGLRLYQQVTESSDPILAASAWMSLGEQQRTQNNYASAIDAFGRAIESSPKWLNPRYSLAATLAQLRRFNDASLQYRKIVELQPTEETAWLGAATAKVLGGADPKQTTDLLASALDALPQSTRLRAALARHLVVTSAITPPEDAVQALELAQGLINLNRSTENLETKAMALAALGRFAEAIATQEELLVNATESDTGRLEANLARYRRQQPCCRN